MNENILERLHETFKASYGLSPAVVSRAPGRLEILGNHTDYNEGLVLGAAVTQSTYFAIAPNGSGNCRILSLGVEDTPAQIPLARIHEKTSRDWKNYVKGVICEIRRRGGAIGGFDAAIASDVPLSAGMSSSAAIEVAACMALEKAFGLEFTPIERAKIGQASENNFVGANTGLLDQFCSVFGKADSLILCDFRQNKVLRNVPIPPGHSIIVVNSMVKHDLVESEYNARRKSCESVVAAIAERNPSVKALRDLSTEELDTFKDAVPLFDYRKARHVTGEDDRVLKAVELLDKGDLSAFGQLLFESHRSSRTDFENSCPELDHLVELAQSIPGCLGARLSGGGFGGISIHLVEEDESENYMRRIRTAFRMKFGKDPQTIKCKAGDGAEWL